MSSGWRCYFCPCYSCCSAVSLCHSQSRGHLPPVSEQTIAAHLFQAGTEGPCNAWLPCTIQLPSLQWKHRKAVLFLALRCPCSCSSQPQGRAQASACGKMGRECWPLHGGVSRVLELGVGARCSPSSAAPSSPYKCSVEGFVL